MFSANYVPYNKWNKVLAISPVVFRVSYFVCTSTFSCQSGFVNSLKFSSSGQFLVAGVGQEHR